MYKKLFQRFFASTLTFVLLFSNIAPTVVLAGDLVKDAEDESTEEVVAEENAEDGSAEEADSEDVADNGELVNDEESVLEEDTETEDASAEAVEVEDTDETAKSTETLDEETAEEQTQDTLKEDNDNLVSTQATGIVQENLRYTDGRVKLINQTEGEKIAAVLPNGKVIHENVNFRGEWEPLQIIEPDKVYIGDKLELFTYEGNSRGKSVFLTVRGEGAERPENQKIVKYGRQAFSFIPTVNSERVLYETDPFFTVEVTFQNGDVFTQTANVLGSASFEFPENFTPRPGQVFSAKVFYREGNEVDLDNKELFEEGAKNEKTTTVDGKITDYQVTIDANGGTMEDEYKETEVAVGDNYTLPYTFESGLAKEGYTLTGYTVKGTLLDKEGNKVTEVSRYPGEYTPQSDVTLTANWEVTSGEFMVLLFDDAPATQPERYGLKLVSKADATEYTLTSNSYGPNNRTWEAENIPNGDYSLVIDNFAITEGQKQGHPDTDSTFAVNENGGADVSLAFEDDAAVSFIRYRVYGEEVKAPNTVTIDPNGGTMKDEYKETEVADGDNYTLPYTFKSGLAKEGYTLTGYTVEGTLLDKDGNEVTEVPRYSKEYTPQSDVTLTANWQVTQGGFRLHDSAPGFITADRSFVLTDGENEYPLTSRSYTNRAREWKVDDLPNGHYTLLVDGIPYASSEWTIEGGRQSGTESSVTFDEEGNPVFDLKFADDKPSTFIRYRLQVNTTPLGIEVRDQDGKRTDEVGVTVKDAEGEVFTGSYNDYKQWLSQDALLPGSYTITLDTPAGTVAKVNDTVANQHAVATDEDNVFTIDVNTENKGSLSSVFAAFKLEESYSLGVEVRDLNNKRTDEVGVTVTNADGEIFAGSYNEYKQWLSQDALLPGSYTITLDTPAGTVAKVNDTVANQHAVATDEANVFTIDVNAENLDSLSSIYAAFKLEKAEEKSYPLGVEVRDLEGKRTDEVGVTVTNADGEVFAGSYNEYKQWLTDEALLVGSYTITLDTPAGTVAKINETVASQKAVATDEANVFTIDVNAENKGNLSSVFAAFKLEKVEDPVDPEEPVEEESYPLGVEVRDLEGKRTDEVGVTVTNADGEVFTGSYNEAKQWLTNEALLVGSYTITLDTPAGTVAKINETAASQKAVATDEANVFTIDVNAENKGNLSSVFAAFILDKVEEPTDPEEPGDPTDPEDNNNSDDNKEEEKPSEDNKEDSDDKQEDKLPETGEVIMTAFAGITLLASGLGLIAADKKKRK